MSDALLCREECAIVLIGAFNPTIFHPQWFVKNNLVSEEELIEDPSTEYEKNPTDQIFIHRDFSQCSFGFAKIEVQTTRFQAKTNDASEYIRLRDLVLSVFSLLEHTPIKQIGINLLYTFVCDSEESWHKIGDALAPKTIWEKTLPRESIGMKQISITTSNLRNDSFDGAINVSVFPNAKKEVTFQVNQHINLFKDGNYLTDLRTVLTEDNWNFYLSDSQKIINVSLAEALK